jgi:hypothetical protein
MSIFMLAANHKECKVVRNLGLLVKKEWSDLDRGA